jgi:hypothetical protein
MRRLVSICACMLVFRRTIERVRDAFSSVASECVHSDAAAQTTAAAQAFMERISAARCAGDRPIEVFSCALLHIQDEASLRLRSFAASDTQCLAPVRSRTSKVQQHALWLRVHDRLLPLLAELDPLSDKSARTLATCLRSALESVVSLVHNATRDVFGFIHRPILVCSCHRWRRHRDQ